MRNVRVNVAIALGLKVAFVVAAAAGVATLWMAVLADTGASVIVLANALRLRRFRYERPARGSRMSRSFATRRRSSSAYSMSTPGGLRRGASLGARSARR